MLLISRNLKNISHYHKKSNHKDDDFHGVTIAKNIRITQHSCIFFFFRLWKSYKIILKFCLKSEDPQTILAIFSDLFWWNLMRYNPDSLISQTIISQVKKLGRYYERIVGRSMFFLIKIKCREELFSGLLFTAHKLFYAELSLEAYYMA